MTMMRHNIYMGSGKSVFHRMTVSENERRRRDTQLFAAYSRVGSIRLSSGQIMILIYLPGHVYHLGRPGGRAANLIQRETIGFWPWEHGCRIIFIVQRLVMVEQTTECMFTNNREVNCSRIFSNFRDPLFLSKRDVSWWPVFTVNFAVCVTAMHFVSSLYCTLPKNRHL